MAAANKGKKLPPEVLTREEVNALLRACSSRYPTGVRNRALIMMLYCGQLRIAEALALEPRDLNRKAGKVRVRRGKGARPRTIGLDEAAWVMLEPWLAMRARGGATGKHRVFCTLRGGKMSDRYVRALLPRLARKAGIEKRVHPHGLRHSGASEMRAAGLDVLTISKQLGHSSIATTHRYLDHISAQEVVDAVRSMNWDVGDGT